MFVMLIDSLATPDPSHSPFNTGLDWFKYYVLQESASFLNRGFPNLILCRRSSVLVTHYFLKLKVFGEGLRCLNDRMSEIEKTASSGDVSFWADQKSELISQSFHEALYESGIDKPYDSLKHCLDDLLQIDFKNSLI